MSAAAEMYSLLRSLDLPRGQLASHSLYRNLRGVTDVRIFMEHHVFAVWDFMSLLKALQRSLTCVEVPWIPKGTARTRRFINKIVLEEETDVIDGGVASHFELYCEAMRMIGADLRPIDALVGALSVGRDISSAFETSGAPVGARAFVNRTFEIVATGRPHVIASAFTFGREEPIPGMFRTLVDGLARSQPKVLSLFKTYLDRHIDLDEDHHAPMAVEMLAEMCGDDAQKWREAKDAALMAISARLALWSAVDSEIALARAGVPMYRAA
jgi:Protein of unknown function (DUF3050)